MTTEGPRYAIYYAPHPESPWGVFARGWLGRCAFDPDSTRRAIARAPAGLDPRLFARVTESPRRYGFHATLKPPFRLAPGATIASLVDTLATVCAQEPGFELPALQVRVLDGFLALVPQPNPPGIVRLAQLASRLVQNFDRWRAPLSPEDRARRQPERLDARERELLEQWGYPWVLDRFRFHLSLTGPLDGVERQDVELIHADAEARLPRDPLRFDAVCLFEESAPRAPLRALRRFPLA
jgi:hypothetical protein